MVIQNIIKALIAKIKYLQENAVTPEERSRWNDKYTKTEVDNKISMIETNIDWKESVDTYDDIITTYPNPEDGWTVNVKDTDYTYRFNGGEWVAISANAIPKATTEIDGLMSKEDKATLDNWNSNHVQGVKGAAETEYRGGLVNITPENIGAVPSSGGTMTGDLIINPGANRSSCSTVYNQTLAYGDSRDNVIWGEFVTIQDKNKIRVGCISTKYNTDGTADIMIAADHGKVLLNDYMGITLEDLKGRITFKRIMGENVQVPSHANQSLK